MNEPEKLKAARDRNLLFGVIAVQLHFIQPADLAKAAAVWATDPGKDLGEVLLEMGLIQDADKNVIDQLLDRQISAHHGDPSATLASFGGNRSVHESFAASIVVKDEGVEASIQSFGGEAAKVPERGGAGCRGAT